MASTLSGTISGSDKTKIGTRFSITRQYEATSILCLVSWIFLIISFSSPYWLSSYTQTYSNFVRLGLWDVCFRNYRHPSYQYDEKFDGCYWFYSAKYQNIREWLQPGWLILVQGLMTIGFIMSTLSLMVISATVMYFLVRFHIVATLVAAGLQTFAAMCILFAVAIFGTYAFDRSWLQYPNFNHLDWAYFVAILTLLLHLGGAGLLVKESWREYQRRRKMNNLVYNMQPRVLLNQMATFFLRTEL
ncbi:claudin superfamily protein pickel isoform X2 [Brevipalpus obovatus]|uniref:claudin superfamily protein pickel isoform X2 n=1 Tax=Brevipalpus obovatus TaxID=246614 RepID=UPI003D9F9D3B